jgi:hypothetical protein
MSEPHRLYAITHSLYSGRARSYLIKQGIPFRKLSTGHEGFKSEGLRNLFLPHEYEPWSPGLTNVEIALLFEAMSKVTWAQSVFNCNAPDYL